MVIAKELNNSIAAAAALKFPGEKIVFGEGSFGAGIMLIGEAPGGDEEEQGRPFVGKAGKNLDEFLSFLGLSRDELYITNVVKIRPKAVSTRTGKIINRSPNRAELEFFTPFILGEVMAVKPQLVVTLGNVPLRVLLGDSSASIGDYHGRVICRGDIRIFPLYHPAAVIYNRKLKQVYYGDLNVLGNLRGTKYYG